MTNYLEYKTMLRVIYGAMFQSPEIKAPFISEKVNLEGYKPPKSFLYDIGVEAGNSIVLVQK
ncbi:MAG: hypothetical protein RJQ14_03335 [Marinoscillum sp.]